MSTNKAGRREACCERSGPYKTWGRAHSGSDPPGETSLDRWLDEPFPDYDTGLVMAFSATRTLRHPL